MSIYTELFKYYTSSICFRKKTIGNVRKKQLEKFAEIFEYAKQHSPFYQKVYSEAGIMDLKIRSWEDVEKVPVIDKSLLRKYSTQEIMTCPIAPDLVLHSTSGSTGEPFKIYQTKFEEFTAHIRVFRLLRSLGYHPFKKIVMIIRYENNARFEVEKELSLLSKLQRVLKIFQRKIVSIYEDPKKMVEDLEKNNADILWTTPSALEVICNELASQNKIMRIPYVVSFAETLFPHQYQKIKECLALNIVNLYGMMECPTIGYEVNGDGKMSVFSEFVLVQEKGNDDMPDQMTPVITNLINHTMPFIRYNTNDISNKVDSKDFPNKVMGNVVGRVNDILQLPDGRIFFYQQASRLFMDFSACERYKFIQQKDGKIILQLKIKENADRSLVEKLAYERWEARFPKEFITIAFVDDFYIDPKTGKFKVMEKL